MSAPVLPPSLGDVVTQEDFAELRAHQLRAIAAWWRAGAPLDRILRPEILEAVAAEHDALAARARTAP